MKALDASNPLEHPGFSCFTGRPDPSRPHRHAEVELMVVEHEPLTWAYGGRRRKLKPGRMAVMWGIRLHQALRAGPRTIGHGVRLPLAWILQFELPARLVHRVLAAEPLVAEPRDGPCCDLELVKHWVRLMSGGGAPARQIVLLEIEARLRELDLRFAGTDRSLGRLPLGLGHFEKMARLIAEGYTQRLSIPRIADAVGLHRTSAMRLFHQVAGMTMLQYIIQQRLAHAQRLLATTDTKLTRVIDESGFRSPTRFFAAFERLVGMTPNAYRQRTRQR